MYGMMHHYILKATSLSTKNITCINICTSTASSTCTLKYGNSITTTMYDNADYLFRYKLCIPKQSHPYWNQSTNCTIFILWDTWHAFECIMHPPQNLPEGNYLLLLIFSSILITPLLLFQITNTDDGRAIRDNLVSNLSTRLAISLNRQ